MKTILFIHGLSAKIEDNIYFIEEMKKYKNIEIHSFILPGHENNHMTKVKQEAWIQKAEEELNKILKRHKEVILVAHSMGSIIAINLASRYKQISKLILLAPAFLYGNFKQNMMDLESLLKNKVDSNIGHGFEGALTKFIEIPKSVMIEYRKLARKNIENIEKITCPTLIMHGLMDNVVPLESSQLVYNKLKCEKDLVWIENIRHQILKSTKKREVTEYIYKYITFPFFYKLTKRKVI